MAGPNRETERTLTGLLLAAIGFLLSWIPYVDILGGLLVFVGIILLFLGRWGFGRRHARNVVAASVGIVLCFLVTVGLAIGFATDLFSIAQAASSNGAPSISSALQRDFTTLLVGTAVIGLIQAGLYVLLVYELAGRTVRAVLWGTYLLNTAITVSVMLYVIPRIVAAVTQATSGSTVDLAPIQELQTTVELLGLLNIIPLVLFAWAYLRCRDDVRTGATPRSS